MISYISENKAEQIVSTRQPLGQFICLSNLTWVGIDNTNGEAKTKTFHTYIGAEEWLKGEK